MLVALDRHAGWMARALVLAERGRATCRPNPMVGCVLVRDGQVVGEGWHERAGGPHAEVNALADCVDARGATAYVTLEPCNHHGRTGPCSVALREAGIAEVVYATADPDPQAAGGAAYLEAAGVRVTGGVLDAWAAEQNHVFLHGVRHQRPHVTLKLAHTREGSLVPPEGRWITGAPARAAVHGMRALVDAVLVGSGTVLADDPRLDVRHVPRPGPAPRAVVLDGRGRSPTDARVVRAGTIIVTTAASHAAWRDDLRALGCEVVVAPGPDALDLQTVMRELWFRDVRAILAEPGATLAAAMLTAGLVDRLVTHVADTPTRADIREPDAISAARAWTVRRRLRRGPDLELERRPPVPPHDED